MYNIIICNRYIFILIVAVVVVVVRVVVVVVVSDISHGRNQVRLTIYYTQVRVALHIPISITHGVPIICRYILLI